MVLKEPGEGDYGSSAFCPFRYARILSIYHANIIFIGPGMINYQPRRMEFVFVRWYESTGEVPAGWEAKKLDRLRFLPMADDGAFGFIDPSDIMRSCHIIPTFARGMLHCDGKGLSSCARDYADWAEYYVGL
jgi:hypothetical protein